MAGIACEVITDIFALLHCGWHKMDAILQTFKMHFLELQFFWFNFSNTFSINHGAIFINGRMVVSAVCIYCKCAAVANQWCSVVFLYARL